MIPVESGSPCKSKSWEWRRRLSRFQLELNTFSMNKELDFSGKLVITGMVMQVLGGIMIFNLDCTF